MQRKRGQIIPRGKDTWLVRYYIGRDEQGKRQYRASTVHGTRKSAQQKLTSLLRDLDTNDVVDQTNMTVGEYVEEYLRTRPDIEERTRDVQREHFSRYIKPYLGTFKMKDLTRPQLRAWHRDLKEKAGLATGTITMTHGVLRTALAQAFEDRLLRQNVADRLPLPKDTRRKEERIRPMSVKETQKLLRVVREEMPQHYAMILTMLTTGVRPNELLALKWVDFKGNRLHIRRAKSREKRSEGLLEFTSGKTAAAERSITLPPEAVRALKEHAQDQIERQVRYKDRYKDQGFVFTTKNGDPLLLEHLREVWKRALEKARLPDRRPYDARHTHATQLLAAGVPVKVVAERLGHTNVVITLRTYAGVLPDMQESVASVASNVLFGDGKGS